MRLLDATSLRQSVERGTGHAGVTPIVEADDVSPRRADGNTGVATITALPLGMTR